VTEVSFKVREDITLSPIRLTDKPALLEYLNTRDIYDTTLNIPFPYLESDANMWLRRKADQRQRLAKEVCFGIRDAQGKLIGP
jgi:[ribosomal protein S5]-alanine N-acetyltransferase